LSGVRLDWRLNSSRRGELIFVPKQSGKAIDAVKLLFPNNKSQTRRGELIFAPDKPNLSFDAVTSELIFAPDKPNLAFEADTSELIFAPDKPNLAFEAVELIYANHESQTRRGELIFAPKQMDKASVNAPNKLQMKSGPFKLWQRGYYDRVIRTQDELIAVKNYIKANPMRWACKMNEV
jgi:hypothetical protein